MLVNIPVEIPKEVCERAHRRLLHTDTNDPLCLRTILSVLLDELNASGIDIVHQDKDLVDALFNTLDLMNQ